MWSSTETEKRNILILYPFQLFLVYFSESYPLLLPRTCQIAEVSSVPPRHVAAWQVLPSVKLAGHLYRTEEAYKIMDLYRRSYSLLSSGMLVKTCSQNGWPLLWEYKNNHEGSTQFSEAGMLMFLRKCERRERETSNPNNGKEVQEGKTHVLGCWLFAFTYSDGPGSDD